MRLHLTILTLLGLVTISGAQGDSAAEFRKELDALRSDYEKRISQLESKILELERESTATPKRTPAPSARRSPGRRAAVSSEPGPIGDDDEFTAAENRETAAREVGMAKKRAVDSSFEGNTETRDIARHADAEAMLAERIEDVLEGYMDITGYFRAGYGRSSEGGPLRAFGAPGVAKYRLGNESENYGELAFAKTFYPSGIFSRKGGMNENDPVARMVYRMSFVNGYDNYGSAANTDFASPELWGTLGNIIPGMPEAKIWAGTRFYRRHDIHMNDFYFWDMSGGGGGIEDVPLWNGKLALAWIGDGSESAIYGNVRVPDPTNKAGFSKSSFDLRYYDWELFGGLGEVGLIYSSAKSGVDELGIQAEDADGFALDLVWTDTGFWDENSIHKLSLQIGNGPAKTFTSGYDTFTNSTGSYIRPDPNESWRFRATDQLVFKPLEELAIGSALVYQYTDFGDNAPQQSWVSGGIRPIWYFNDVFSLAFEGGVDWLSETANGNGGTVGKLTLAPQVSLGDQFFSRPVLRAFATYGLWSDGLKGEVGGADYANATSGWSWGLQMETWW